MLRLQHKILLETKWEVRRGTPIYYNYGRIKKCVPTWAKKQLDIIMEAYKEQKKVKANGNGKTHWRATFFNLADLSREGSEARSRTRYKSTQKFYDSTKTPSSLYDFTRK